MLAVVYMYVRVDKIAVYSENCRKFMLLMFSLMLSMCIKFIVTGPILIYFLKLLLDFLMKYIYYIESA